MSYINDLWSKVAIAAAVAAAAAAAAASAAAATTAVPPPRPEPNTATGLPPSASKMRWLTLRFVREICTS